jgi:hypothetical protein
LYKTLAPLSAILICWLVLAMSIFWLEHSSNRGSETGEIAIQLFTSSWPARWDQVLGRESVLFSLGVASRLILVIGPLAGIIAVFQKLLSGRSAFMKYLTLLQLRDQTIEDKFLESELVGEAKEQFRAALESAVKAANADLPRQLADLFGTEKANQLLEGMNREAL